MNKKIYILCVDDELDVLNAVVDDITELENLFPIESASSAAEALELVNEIHEKGFHVGLILCDHIMPQQTGVDLLIKLHEEERNKLIRKVLLTGQAGLDDTVAAINFAKITHYIAKPWNKDELLTICKRELGNFIINSDIDPMPYLSILDPDQIQRAVSHGIMGD
jgi:response regulator RpfG family c-di-GMP phosphodiesterase